ncbi:hypothetical protein BDZ90DRAFT_40685 [Jaminaea rosea]|uniref:Uncharacterized protein n=1 Tax=Jaminaea rosea TaxID=1569628 RepID=A0A316UMS0_9BASI|nr:hypothetical protein BDZ90DRAFT_40685 [Jaminaea rosea]PWN26530.1 hypothetical protein BDZ90DRAFT_40685 [Jaminaea rosea]
MAGATRPLAAKARPSPSVSAAAALTRNQPPAMASTRAMTVSTSRIGNIGPSLAQQIPDPWPLYQAYGLVDSVVPSKLPRRCRSGSRSSDAMGLPMLAITDISSNSSKTFTLHDSPANGSTTILPSVTDTLQCTRSSITLEPVEADAVSPPACCLALWLLSLRA